MKRPASKHEPSTAGRCADGDLPEPPELPWVSLSMSDVASGGELTVPTSNRSAFIQFTHDDHPIPKVSYGKLAVGKTVSKPAPARETDAKTV